MIRASVSADNDDYGPVIDFDATPWFEQASERDIQHLRDEGYGCGEESDGVAEFMADRDAIVAEFFTYLSFRQEHGRGRGGYTVRIGDRDADAWIAENRPHLAIEAKA